MEPQRNNLPNAELEPLQARRSRRSIIFGIGCGTAAICVYAEDEPSFYWRFTNWLFHEEIPAKIIEPRTIHLNLFTPPLVVIGGAVGVLFAKFNRQWIASLPARRRFQPVRSLLDRRRPGYADRFGRVVASVTVEKGIVL